MIVSMEVDEERIYTLTKYSTKKVSRIKKESDHNMLFMKIESTWNTKINEAEERIEIYNYKNADNFKKFAETTENNKELDMCFEDDNEDLEESSIRWLSVVNKIIKKSFRRIRMNNKKNSDFELQ